MARTTTKSRTGQTRGLLARPLDSLVFLFPFLVFYEYASSQRQDRVIAFDLLRRSFEWFGSVGLAAPGLAVVVVLLAAHVASKERWVVHWGRVGWMFPEAIGLALPLLLLNRLTALAAGGGVHGPTLVDALAIGIGAGIYEELVFRLGMISVLVILGSDLMRLEESAVAVAAVAISSFLFAAHHHPPVGAEPFGVVPFLFRTMAGAYLAVIFWYRGYGPAAGAHAAYNVVLTLLRP